MSLMDKSKPTSSLGVEDSMTNRKVKEIRILWTAAFFLSWRSLIFKCRSWWVSSLHHCSYFLSRSNKTATDTSSLVKGTHGNGLGSGIRAWDYEKHRETLTILGALSLDITTDPPLSISPFLHSMAPYTRIVNPSPGPVHYLCSLFHSYSLKISRRFLNWLKKSHFVPRSKMIGWHLRSALQPLLSPPSMCGPKVKDPRVY